jgi:hypothetical protein
MKFLKTIRRMTWLRDKADLGRGPVLSTLIKLSVPSIAMVLFHTLFHLVDTVFISWLGESHMVAISYTFPVQIGVFALHHQVCLYDQHSNNGRAGAYRRPFSVSRYPALQAY